MKKAKNLPSIIAIVTVIGFVFAACDDGGTTGTTVLGNRRCPPLTKRRVMWVSGGVGTRERSDRLT